jgi:signal transduction histidine kinase
LKTSLTVIASLWLAIIGTHAAGPLRSLAEVRALPVEAARASQSVRIEAVVLYADASTHDMIVHDGATACYAITDFRAAAPENRPKTGDRVLLEGVTRTDGFLPHIESRTWTILGHAELPEPYRISADEIYLPRFDTAWVEVPAVVVGVETGGLAYTLAVEVFGQSFKADVPNMPDAAVRAAALMQRPVRMRAILGTIFNNNKQLTGRHFFVPSFDCISPTAPAADATDAPLMTVLELLQSNSSPADLVRVEGVITQEDAKGFHLRDASGSAFVQAVMTEHLPPGTRVSVEGYGAVSPFRPVLRATKVTQMDTGPPPEPLAMDFHAADVSIFQMEFVTVDAVLLGSRSIRDETILQCATDGTVFDAILPHGSALSNFLPGDRLKLTGICELTTTHPMPRPEWINGFRIRLAAAGGIKLLHRAPWWTPGRLLTALGAMTGLAALGAFGTLFFRRVVNRQAMMIGEKLGDEAVRVERDRMARDLHDTLEQQLTGVAMQLESLAKSPHPQPPGFTNRLSLASRMLQHSREEARRSVWDLRNRVLENHGFAAALESLADSAAIDGGPHVATRISGTRAHLPTTVTYPLLRIAQESLANALKHARASQILITLDMATGHYRLSISDDGVGFDPNLKDPSGPPHFGLIGMRERASKVGAALDIASRPGGTTITVTLPLPPP